MYRVRLNERELLFKYDNINAVIAFNNRGKEGISDCNRSL